MAIIENLTNDGVVVLKKFFDEKLKPVNPGALLSVMPVSNIHKKSEAVSDERLHKIEESIIALNNKLDLIFSIIGSSWFTLFKCFRKTGCLY